MIGATEIQLSSVAADWIRMWYPLEKRAEPIRRLCEVILALTMNACPIEMKSLPTYRDTKYIAFDRVKPDFARIACSSDIERIQSYKYACENAGRWAERF